MKRVILVAALVSGTAMAGEFTYDVEPYSAYPEILPVAPISRNAPTTIWQADNYTFIQEPRSTTVVQQLGQLTYIREQNTLNQTVCQTIGKFTYCN